MFDALKEDHSDALNQALLAAVPPAARTILEVGRGDGRLGAALRAQHPGRRVWGIEVQPEAAGRAGALLADMFPLASEVATPPLLEGSVDCLLLGDGLQRLRDPLAVLRRLRPLLGPGGSVLAWVPNDQHHSLLTALVSGDFPYQDSSLLAGPHRQLFSCSTLFKLFLDAALAPHLRTILSDPMPEDLWRTLQPLLRHLRLHPERTRQDLEVYQYVVAGIPLDRIPEETGGDADGTALTFVACVNDRAQARANLLASPCLAPGTAHEVLLFADCGSAAAGLNRGLQQARHERVVCLHQDVYLPAGWDRQFSAAWDQAEARLGRAGVVGVYGVRLAGGKVEKAGQVLDRIRLLREPIALPARIDTLDELLLGVRRDSGLAFDPSLGFHFYGADLCLQARGRGLGAVALDALCFHNSRSLELPPEFTVSAGRFARKWRQQLPVATSCVVLQPDGRCYLS